MSELLAFILCMQFHIATATILPIRTSVGSNIHSHVPLAPTAVPEAHHELIKRATTSSSSSKRSLLNYCGWINGDYDSSLTCYSTETCLWNTRNKVVDCYDNTAILPHYTTCIVANSASSCDSACSANPNLLICKSPNDCYTALYPDGYSAVSCKYNYPSTVNVALTYGGQPTPVFIPRFLGDDGTITLSTQVPLGYTSADAQESEQPSTTKSSSKPVNSDPKDSGEHKTNLGPILGGSIGGGIFVLAICVGIFYYTRVRAKRKDLYVPSQYIPVKKSDVVEQESGSTAQELDGRSSTVYELT